uniref:Uso1_p115_head domain-containing protein n=1 Tax=Parastrongyloides trichosuri TaxID=131310 RepID=A0A0N4ZCJ4_PARTI
MNSGELRVSREQFENLLNGFNNLDNDEQFFITAFSKLPVDIKEYRKEIGTAVFGVLHEKPIHDKHAVSYPFIVAGYKILDDIFYLEEHDPTDNVLEELAYFFIEGVNDIETLSEQIQCGVEDLAVFSSKLLQHITKCYPNEVIGIVGNIQFASYLIDLLRSNNLNYFNLAHKLLSTFCIYSSDFVRCIDNLHFIPQCFEILCYLDENDYRIGKIFHIIGCAFKTSAYTARIFANDLVLFSQLCGIFCKILDPEINEHGESGYHYWTSERTENAKMVLFFVKSLLIHEKKMSIKDDCQAFFSQNSVLETIARIAFYYGIGAPSQEMVIDSRSVVARLIDNCYSSQSMFANMKIVNLDHVPFSLLNAAINDIDKYCTADQSLFGLLDVFIAIQNGNELIFDTWFGSASVGFNNVAPQESNIILKLYEFFSGYSFASWFSSTILTSVFLNCKENAKNLWNYPVNLYRENVLLHEIILDELTHRPITDGESKTGFLCLLFTALEVYSDVIPEFINNERYIRCLKNEIDYPLGDKKYSMANKGIASMIFANIYLKKEKFDKNVQDQIWMIVNEQLGLAVLSEAIDDFTKMKEYKEASENANSFDDYHLKDVYLDHVVCKVFKSKEFDFFKILNGDKGRISKDAKKLIVAPYLETIRKQDVKICELTNKVNLLEIANKKIIDEMVKNLGSEKMVGIFEMNKTEHNASG